MLPARADVALPNTQHAVAACAHICILGRIKHGSSPLAHTRNWKFRWIAMPIVPIELNDQARRWHESIYTEFFTDQELRFIGNVDGGQNLIACSLKIIDITSGLDGVHVNQPLASLRICIATRRRAVEWLPVRLARWRPRELVAAHFAAVVVAIASLPLIGMSARAKELLGRLYSILIKGGELATDSACALFSRHALRFFRFCIAWVRAILACWWKSASYSQSASYANNCSHFVNWFFAHAVAMEPHVDKAAS